MKKLIGHESILNELIELNNDNKLPNKILLTGNKGIGKSLLVDHFLKDIYTNEDKIKTESLIDHNTHPNIFKIYKKNEKKNIEISQIREMIKFQNHSSFNNIHKTIVINDVEYLNLNSTNALLKTLEEPNGNDLFILINNSNSNILDTIKSRCIEFKLNLVEKEIIEIINNYFDDEIYEKISNDFKNFYISPSFIISFILFLNEIKIDHTNLNIENFLTILIKNKYFIKNEFISNNYDTFIELFFFKNINITKKVSYKIKDYFYIKLKKIKNYNLDIDSFFMEFEEKLLSE